MPQNPIALCDLGLALKETGDIESAITNLRRAIELKPDFERAKYGLGVALQMHGQTAEAASEMREIRGLHQMRTELAESKRLILDGVQQMKATQWQDAKVRFEQAAKLSPDLPAAYYYRGQSEAKLGETSKALESYRKALDLAPDYAEAHMALGVLYARTGRTEAGLDQLREAVLSDPDLADAHYNLALMLVSAGDKRGALSELSEALSLDPANSDARIVVDNLLRGQSRTSSER